jgi:hypothetical protein
MNYIYEQIQKIFTTEEEALKNILNNFFLEYDDIIQEYKIIFIIHVQKIDSLYVKSLNEESLCYSKILINDKQPNKIKKNNYKYKFTFNCENYKQQNKLFFVNIFIPGSFRTGFTTSYNLNYDYMVYQKYYYNIYFYENKIMNFVKEYKYYNKNYEEITLKSIVTEIIDNIIQF